MSWRDKTLAYLYQLAKLPEAKAIEVQHYVNGKKPLFCKLTDMFNGTCRFFACVFTFFGILLAWKGRLTTEYVSLVGAIQLLLTAHSIGQDYHERNSDAPETKP